jgi:hypothetical protein
MGKDPFAPERSSHLEATLLPPVVSEVHGIDVVPKGFLGLGDVVVGNSLEQLMDESGVVVEIHHEVLHAAKGPASLVEGEANLEDTEAIRELGNSRRDLAEEARVERIRELIPSQVRLRENAALDDADVLVDAAVPHDAENVPHAVVSELVKEPDVTSQVDEVVLNPILESVRSVVEMQRLRSFLGEPD